LYWWFHNKEKPFYKYRLPLKKREDESQVQYDERAKFYNEGDSWCEELGFSKDEFDTALKRIAHKRGDAVIDADKYPIKLFIEYYTTLTRVTYYNICDAQALNDIITNHYSKSDNPDLRPYEKPDLRAATIPKENNRTESTSENTSETFSKEKDHSFQEEATNEEPVVAKDFVGPENIHGLKEKIVVVPEESKSVYAAVIDYWNSKGLTQHREGTKRHDEIIRLLHKFALGIFPYKVEQERFKGKKFKRKDFIKSIDQFALAATDPDYEASIGSSYKEKLRKTPLHEFLWNTFSNGEIHKSLFLHFFENDAKLVTDKYLKDEDPGLTKAIMDEYQRQQLGTKDEIKSKGPFVKATKRLKAFLEVNKKRLMPGRNLSDENIARWLVTAVTNASRGKAISAAFLASDLTYEQILPIYLQNEAIFTRTDGERTPKYKMVNN